MAAEQIQRQETVAVVVAVKEPADLVAVNRIVGGVEVEDQLPGRLGMRFDENLHQFPTDLPAHLARGAIFKTAQAWRCWPNPCPGPRRFAARYPFARSHDR